MTDLREVAFMLLLTTVCVFVLGLNEIVFRHATAANDTLSHQVIRLLPELFPAEVVAHPSRAAFSTAFRSLRRNGVTATILQCRQHPAILLCEREGYGAWGRITLLIAWDAVANRLLGIDVVAQQETPGLGARIEEEEFLSQFRNLACGKSLRAVRARVRDGEFDAITGATMTSESVADLINQALVDLRRVAAELRKEEQR